MDTATLLRQSTGLSRSEAARMFATAGVPVFPCVPGGKRPLTSHGFHDATCDPAQIGTWWGRWPAAKGLLQV